MSNTPFWEATARRDNRASHWFDLWQKYCVKLHHGKRGLTLGDSVTPNLHRERWLVPQEEEAKAYKRVRDGLRQVFNKTVEHYFPGSAADPTLMTGRDDAAILYHVIRTSFRIAKTFASPEGMEFFLLTLIKSFEQSLGAKEDRLFCQKVWYWEIRRRRLGGPPQTKTLADVAPAKVRSERDKAFPEKERLEIVKKMLFSMRRITKELQSYLEKCTPCCNDGNGAF